MGVSLFYITLEINESEYEIQNYNKALRISYKVFKPSKVRRDENGSLQNYGNLAFELRMNTILHYLRSKIQEELLATAFSITTEMKQ